MNYLYHVFHHYRQLVSQNRGNRDWLRGRSVSYPKGLIRCLTLSLLLCLLLQPSAPLARAQTDDVIGTIIVAIASDGEPFAAQAANGQVVGFDVDLVKMLVRTAGLRVSYEVVPFVQLIPGVATQLYDAAVGCIGTTDERKALVDFTDTYFSTGSFFAFSMNNPPIYDLTDLTPETRISVMAETVGWSFLTKQSEAQIVTTPSVQRALELAAARLTDAAFVEEISVDRFMRLHPEAGLQVVSGLVNQGGCAIAVSKENPHLLLEMNAALTRLKNNGRYLAAYRRWFGNRPLSGPRPLRRPTADAAAAAPLLTPTVQSMDIPYADLVSGTYAMTLLTDPVVYQLIELTADGRWLESASVREADAIPDIPSPAEGAVAVQEGRWEGSRRDQLATTVEISATLPFTAAIVPTDSVQPVVPLRREYQLTVEESGRLYGTYTFYTTLLPTTPVTATLTTTLTGTGALTDTATSIVTVGITQTVLITEVVELTGRRVVE
jgi:ABC-type amino acid transport substrate-binding protein